MTKRLQEILNDLPSSIRYSGELESLKKYAREQAERVEELEKENNRVSRVKEICERDNSRLTDYRNLLEQQNKRYREALESIANNDETYLLSHEIACKALEREG